MSIEDKIKYISLYPYIYYLLEMELVFKDDIFTLTNTKLGTINYQTDKISNIQKYLRNLGYAGEYCYLAKKALSLYFLDCYDLRTVTNLRNIELMIGDNPYLYTRFYNDKFSADYNYIKFGIVNYKFNIDKVKQYMCPYCHAVYESFEKTENAIIFDCTECGKKTIEIL